MPERKPAPAVRLKAEWKDYFGAAVVPGPLGAELPHLVEFVLERAGGLPDELPEDS